MLAYREWKRAIRAWEKRRLEMGSWERRRRPWVRPESEIATLLGRSQPTVHRRLKAAEQFVHDCVKARLDEEPLVAE